MALTSIKNEPCRVEKQLQEMTWTGRYMNDVPGPGADVCFFEDPHFRLQKWGANLRTNTINLESDLMGLSRHLNRDCVDKNQHNAAAAAAQSQPISYGSCEPTTEESRVIMPAWTLRGVEQEHWDYLLANPQNTSNLFIPTPTYENTRNTGRDAYQTTFPCTYGVNLANIQAANQ